jgi:hypothetical protein
MTIKSRLIKLEKARTPKVRRYFCLIVDVLGIRTPEEQAKGFEIQCATVEWGGTGGEPFYLANQADLDAFGAREDVHLVIVRFVDDGSEPEEDDQDDLS